MRLSDRLLNKGHRIAYRLAYPLMLKWWSYYGSDGVMIAIWIDDHVLAVQHSYKPGLRLPGGGMMRGENERLTSVRELQEELGLIISPDDVTPILTTSSMYGLVHLFEMRLFAMPKLIIDHREIIHAEFVTPASIHEHNPDILSYLRP